MSDVVPDNFLGLPHKWARYDAARFAVLPVPYDATTSYSVGTREGPRAIISASQQVEFFDEALGCESLRDGVVTLDPVHPVVSGPADMIEAVYRAARKPVRDGKFLLTLGGEHSITSGPVRAVGEKYRDLSVLQIDAHADMRAEYQGSPWSHAAVMRRVVEMGVPVVGVGIRNYSRDEARFIEETGIVAGRPDWYTGAWKGRIERGNAGRRSGSRAGAAGGKDAKATGIASSRKSAAPKTSESVAPYVLVSARYLRHAADAPSNRPHPWVVRNQTGGEPGTWSPRSSDPESRSWIGEVVGALTDNVYVTIDIDGFDPAYAPGTGTPEPGGMDWYQVTDLLAAVARGRNIVAADLVEVKPIPPNNVTEFLAAKLLYRLIGLVSMGDAKG